MQVQGAASSDDEGRDFIEQLRRSKFMIGMVLSADAAEAAEGLRQDLSSALRLLSEDLYSTKTHFVLELIQNADDNTYARGIAPQIQITVTPRMLQVWNNELGFTQDNVRALCSVGRSTKAKKAGFIGEKGIGFKSVFQISNIPEIHSNGFHFRFDMSDPEQHLGYIVPTWVAPDTHTASHGTTIVLPAKDGEAYSAAVLAELDARLLLFLRKLRQIDLQTPEEVVSMRSEDDDGIVTLETRRQAEGMDATNTRRHFLRVATTVSMAEAPDEKRPQIGESEIILAFPIDDAGKAIATADCATFAFLPIRDFGFRFCVQADFLLSSAREDIQAARPWNISLRDAIAPAYVASLEQFKARPALARTFLQYLPREQEVSHSFFAPVVQQTLAALTPSECILCATGQWRRPSHVMTASAAFQHLVPAEHAWKLFGKDYPAKDFDVDQTTLKKLGCEALTISDIVRLFTDHGAWVSEQGTTWLVRCYRYLAGLQRQHLLDAGLRNTPCVPVSDGALQAPSKRTVFFPLADGKTFGFEKDLLILDATFAQAIAAQDQVSDASKIRGLLHDLGVRTPEPYALIIDDILPAHQGTRWQDAGFEALTGHVRYVKEKLGDYLATAIKRGVQEAAAMETLRKGLRLKTKKNESNQWWFQHADEVYPGQEYLPEFDIEALLGQDLDPLRLLSPDYLPEDLPKLDPEGRAAAIADWRAFFLRLGVNRSPRLSIGVNAAACSAELDKLLASENAAIRRQTLECLDRHWDYYSRHATHTLASRPGNRFYTAFATALRATTAPTRQKRSVALQEAYYATDAVREIFGSSPTYVDAKFNDEGFLDICGIVHRVDSSACIKRLRQIKASDRPSTAQLRPLYRQLDRLSEHHAGSGVRDAFEEHALILTRHAESPWRRPDEVVWSSPGEFLALHYPMLNAQYPELHGFFVRRLGVAHEVSVPAAVRALPLLATSGLTEEARAAEALRIYVRASQELVSAGDSAAPRWLQDFRSNAVFMNHRSEMVSLDDALFADDQPAISALFSSEKDISFLKVPPARLPKIQVLLDAVGLPLLSASVNVALEQPGAGRINPIFTGRLRERYRHVARLVYGLSHTVFERAKATGLWRHLSLLTVLDVDQLTVLTTLQGCTVSSQGEVVIAGNAAYVRVGSRGTADRLAREICGLLKAPMTHVDGISRILREEHLAEVEEYLDVRDLVALPDDELSQLTLEAPPIVAEDVDPSEPVDVEMSSPEIPRPPAPASASESTPGSQAVDSATPSSSGTSMGGALATHTPTSRTSEGGGAAHTPSPSAISDAANQAKDLPYITSPARSTSSTPPPGSTSPSNSTGTRRRPTGRHRRTRLTGRGDTGHRLLSYVEPNDLPAKPREDDAIASGNDTDRTRARDATAQAAVLHFMHSQREKWASLEEMPHFNKGFDIRAVAHDGTEHFIEIKGQSAAWTVAGIAMTPAELLWAAECRARYWLCVVEHAMQPGQQILHLVNNPFGRADQFRFDSGWKAAAIREAAAPPLVPTAGLRIEIPGLGTGTIASVKKGGSMFSKVHVYLADGRQVFRVFDPARMRLSKGD